MSDVNYLGLGVNFVGVDKGLFKKMKRAKVQSIELTEHFNSLEKSISSANERMNLNFPSQGFRELAQANEASERFAVSSEGLSGQVVRLGDSFEELGEKVQKTQKKQDGFFSSMGSGLRNLSGFVNDLVVKMAGFSLMKTLNPIKNLLVGTNDIQETTKQVDALRMRMAQVYDPKMAYEFQRATLANMRNFGVMGEQAKTIADTLNSYVMPLEQMKDILPEIGVLVGVMGMEAKGVAEMFSRSSKQLRMMPGDMMGVVKQVNAMGAAFGILDFTKDLPEIVNQVSDSLLKLGRLNERNARQAIESTAAIKAQFQALGMGGEQATQAATGFQGKISDMTRSIRRMSVGMEPLNDDWLQFARTMQESTGKSFEYVGKLMEKGIEDPTAVMGELISVGRGLTKQQQIRFTERVRDTFGPAGDAIANAIISPKALDQALAIAEKKIADIDPEKQFQRQVAAQEKTFTFKKKILDVNKQLVDVERELSVKTPIIASLEAQTGAYREVQDAIVDLNSPMGKFIRQLTAIEKGGLSASAALNGFPDFAKRFGEIGGFLGAGGTLATGFGIVSAGLLGVGKVLRLLFSPLQTLGKLREKVIQPIINGVSKLTGGLSRMVEKVVPKFKFFSKIATGSFGRIFGIASKVLGPISTLIAFAGDLKEAFTDFTSGDILGGIGQLLTGGIESTIADQAMKFGSLGMTVGGMLGGPMGAAVGGALGASIGAVTKWFNQSEIAKKFDDWAFKFFKGDQEVEFEKMRKELDATGRVVGEGFTIDTSKMVAPGKVKMKAPQVEKPSMMSLPVKPDLQDMPDLQTLQNQESAPRRSRLGSAYKPEEMPKADDKNFNALIKAITVMRDDLGEAIESLSQQPVVVTLQGDARKFLQVMNQDSKSRITSMGKQAVLGRG